MSADGRGGHPFGNQARRDAGNLEQRLENLVLLGKVEQRDEEAVKLRVRFGAKEDKFSVLSPWLPILEKRSYDTRQNSMLYDIDEWVVVLNPSGLIENGMVLCALPYYDPETDKGFVHTTKSKDDERIFYGPVRVLADIVKYCVKTFNKARAYFWHYLKDGGTFRFEVGKNNNKNTYVQIEDGKIELRVGTTKVTLTENGIAGYYSGDAASFALNQGGLTVGLRNAPEFAKVPTDNMGGASGSSEGAGVGNVLGVEQTTLRLVNGQMTVTMDDKAQFVMNPETVVTTLKDRAQHVITKEAIESTVWKTDKNKSASLVVDPDKSTLEIHGTVPMRATLNTAQGGQVEIQIAQTRIALTPLVVDARTPGTSLSLTTAGMTAVAPNYNFTQGTAPGVPWQPGANPTDEVDKAKHPTTTPPDDLARPEVELGVKPFTPDM